MLFFVWTYLCLFVFGFHFHLFMLFRCLFVPMHIFLLFFGMWEEAGWAGVVEGGQPICYIFGLPSFWVFGVVSSAALRIQAGPKSCGAGQDPESKSPKGRLQVKPGHAADISARPQD
jgi:hypothetical protein